MTFKIDKGVTQLEYYMYMQLDPPASDRIVRVLLTPPLTINIIYDMRRNFACLCLHVSTKTYKVQSTLYIIQSVRDRTAEALINFSISGYLHEG